MYTPRENFIRFLKNEPYEYTPTGDDMLRFLPDIIPCYISRGLIVQQEPYTGELGGRDFFGVDWYYDPDARGSMEVAPLLDDPDDLLEWEDKLSFPDLDAIDWEGCAKANSEYLKTDKIINSTIYSSFFERLISFVGFEDAAVALVDDELQEAVHRLFGRLADFYIDLIRRLHDHMGVELITLHDDWGTQRSTMFSVETHTEMILPYVKKVIDAAHSMGVFVEQHSCGRIEALVPNIIASGADTWRGQNVNDKKLLVEEYGDRFRFGVEISLAVPADGQLSDEEAVAQVQKTLDDYRGKAVWYTYPRSMSPRQKELVAGLL